MTKVQKAPAFTAKISIFLILFCTIFVSCKSSAQETISASNTEISATFAGEDKNSTLQDKSQNQSETKEKPSEEQKKTSSDAVKIKIEKRPMSYFASIDSSALLDFQIGSPTSLNRCISKIRKATIDYEENERVLYNIASRLMTTVWQKASPITQVPPLGEVSATARNYLAIIDSANSGVYEGKKDDKDFLALVLPCLVVLKSPNQNNFSEIETSLQKAIAINNNSVLCYYLLGKLYQHSKQYEKAIECFDKATEQNSAAFEVLYEKSLCLIELKRFDAAFNILDRLLIQYPSDMQLLKLYAQSAYVMKDYSKAELYASQILQQNPSDLEYLLFRAKIFVETGEYLKASSLLDVYARSFPTQHECLLLRAKLQREWNKNLTASISTIERALSLYPDDQDIIIYATELACETGSKINGKTGGQLAQMILQKDPNNIQGLQYSVQSMYNDEQYEQAYNSSRQLMAVAGVPQDAILMHIQICLSRGYNDEAWRYVSSLYEKNPDNQEIVQNYIDVMIKTGRNQSATRLINSLLSNNPSASLKSFLFYERSFLTSNESSALSDLRSSLIANPRNSDALFRMYQIYYNRKDYKKAQYYLKQVVSLNPNNERYIRLNAQLETLVQ